MSLTAARKPEVPQSTGAAVSGSTDASEAPMSPGLPQHLRLAAARARATSRCACSVAATARKLRSIRKHASGALPQ